MTAPVPAIDHDTASKLGAGGDLAFVLVYDKQGNCTAYRGPNTTDETANTAQRVPEVKVLGGDQPSSAGQPIVERHMLGPVGCCYYVRMPDGSYRIICID